MLEKKEIISPIYGTYIFLITDTVVLINTTPHAIRFAEPDGVVELEATPSVLLNASVEEREVGGDLVTTCFKPSPEGWKIIDRIEKVWASDPELSSKKLRIIGSIIACQAYPGKCMGMIPYPGFERVAPAQKLMRLDKFNVYGVK